MTAMRRRDPARLRAGLFDTSIGACGLAWSDRGLVRVQLPEADRRATARRLSAELGGVRVGGSVPRSMRGTAARIRRLLSGRPDDLCDVAVDLSRATEFERLVFEEARRIGPGSTATYGEIARRIGKSGSARAVGGALGRNPLAIVVPCHRILASGGGAGGFSAHGGVVTKLRLLRIEGAGAGSPGKPVRCGAGPGAPVGWLRDADPVMRGIIDRVGPCALRTERGGHFEGLVEAIVYQQLAGRAAATIFRRVRSVFPGGRFPSPAEVLRVSDAKLRAAGLSRQKIGYIRDLAGRVADGSLRLDRIARMDDDAVVAALTAVKGIGRWTADMFLIFRLGRRDVLPVGDYGLRKAFQKAYALRTLPSPATMAGIAERWRPYRTIAAWYLWRTEGPVLVGEP